MNSVKEMRSKGLPHRVAGFMLILLCLGTVVAASAQNHTGTEAPLISKIDIEITANNDSSDKWIKISKDLLPIQPGELFSQKKLTFAKAELMSSGFFKTIEVKTHSLENGMVCVNFLLTPFPLIKNILVKGSFPVSEREVLNATNLYTGKPFNEEALPKQEKTILQLLKNNGFIQPSVRIVVEKADGGNVVVKIDIDKGIFYYIQKVDVNGNRSFSDVRLKIRTNTWQSSLLPGAMSRFIRKKLDEDVKNLTAFYRSHNFPDVSVTSKIEKNDETSQVLIHFFIDEGDRYEITFHGNEEFWDMTLSDDLAPLQQGNRRNISLRKSIRNIKDRYQKAGYKECIVKQQSVPSEQAQKYVRPVRLIIKEGPRSLVKHLKIEGNQDIPEEKIRDQILTRPPELFTDGEFNDQVLENDIRAIQVLYSDNGYTSTKIEKKITWQQDDSHILRLADIVLLIEEGKKITITSIDFSGLNALTKEDAFQTISLKPGGPFKKHALTNDVNQLAAAISEKGHPHVVVTETAEISHDGTEAKIIYSVVEGPFVTMGNTHTSGNFRTSDTIVKEEMELKKDMPFSMIKMLESQRNIKNINAFETARTLPIGLKEKKDKVHLMVEVEEKKPYSLEAGFGYDTPRHLYGNIRLGDQNLLGLNKNAWIDLEVSQIGYRGETGISEPRFLGTRILSSLTLFGEKKEEFNQNFGTESQGVIWSFSRRLPYNFTAGLAFSLERKEQYLRDEQPLLAEELEEYDPRSILVTTPSIVYDTVDSYFRPRKGIYSSIKMDVSTGLENSLDNFIKYQYEIKLYHTFFKRLTLACRGRAGHIIPAGSESNIPDDQLFYLGGLTDVRGYNENLLRFDEEHKAVGGRTLFTGTIEARFDAGFNIEIASFFDTGSIQNAPSNEGSDDFRSSVGIGLRYLFPYLPVGLQYAHKLDRIKASEDAGKFYVTIGYIF